MAEQRHIERRGTRRVGGQRRRRRACHLPPAMGGAGHWLDPRAQQQCHHPALSGGKRQPARGGEVEGGCLADRLDDHRTDCTASRDVGPGPEGGNGIGRFDQEQDIRRDAQSGQTMAIWSSAKPGFRFPHPEYGLSPIGTACEEQGKGHGTRCIAGDGINFMQRRSNEAAAQPLIQRLRPKGNLPGMDSAAEFQPASHQRLKH